MFLGRYKTKIVLDHETEENMEGDKHLIGEAVRLEMRHRELNIVKRVIMFMQVTALSQIANAKGTPISKEWYVKGNKSSRSNKNGLE